MLRIVLLTLYLKPVWNEENLVLLSLPSHLDQHFHPPNHNSKHPNLGFVYKEWKTLPNPTSKRVNKFLPFSQTKDLRDDPLQQFHENLFDPVDRQSVSTPRIRDLLLVIFLLGSSIVFTSFLLMPRLENHEMCGITTGGQVSANYQTIG